MENYFAHMHVSTPVIILSGQALSKAIAYIVIRKSRDKVYFLTMVFWYAIFSTTIAALCLLIAFLSFRAAGSHTLLLMIEL